MIDKILIDKAIHFKSMYIGSEVYESIFRSCDRVDVRVAIYNGSLRVTIWCHYPDRQYLTIINDWYLSVDFDSHITLYYLALSLPPRVLQKVISINPTLLSSYRDTMRDGDHMITIIQYYANIYTIWYDGTYHVRENRDIAIVPVLMYSMCRSSKIPTMIEAVPMLLYGWRDKTFTTDIDVVCAV